MRKHLSRTILIYAVIAVAAILVYPTIGWMMLSPEERQARLDRWEEEDAVYQKPSLTGDITKTVGRWAQCDRSRVINLGLDLQGGVHMVIGFDLTEEQKAEGIKDDYIQRLVLQKIRRRIHEFEAQEPIIQALGTNQVQIQLPGVKDPDRAMKLIMQTALLTFHIVAGRDETTTVFRAIKDAYPERFTPFLLAPTPNQPFFRVPEEHIEKVRRVVAEAAEASGIIPEGKTVAFSQPPNPWDDYQGYFIYVMDKKPLMTGEGLRMATSRPDDDSPGNWQILFEFEAGPARQFGQVTETNINRSMAIVLDGVVCSAPVIRSKITTMGSITGAFSPEQATDLAIALTSGSMPVQLREDYTGVVGASLGADSVRKGVLSSILAALVVAVFMLIYYRLAGVIANVALALNAVLMLGALAYFNATLTLPGIAGFILTLGMAVDANVLIFERIREEIRNGKSLLAAIDSGYRRATVTILDANITTLIAAAVLMQFGTGPIKGFAVTLSIGVCSSVFTALVVTWAIFDFLTARKKLAKLTMMSMVKPDTRFPFLAKRWWAFSASAALIVVGLVVFGIRGNGNYGVDFTQGTSMIVSLNTPETIGVGAVRSNLEAAGLLSPIVQEYGTGNAESPNRFVIRIREAEGSAVDTEQGPEATTPSRVRDALASLAGNDPERVVFEESQTVGPAVGKELRQDALLAITYALVFILAYLWFRFELKFALGAVAALFHDVLITIGLFAITGREISMPVIAAILTIIGYSLNDTIVVFDRVREDLRLYRGRGLTFAEILDLSINQTLSRTILTALTTVFVVVILFFFGGSAINDFAFALIVGIVVGTYSSIFVASPVVYFWQKLQGKHISPAAAGRAEAAKRGRKQNRNNAKSDESPA